MTEPNAATHHPDFATISLILLGVMQLGIDSLGTSEPWTLEQMQQALQPPKFVVPPLPKGYELVKGKAPANGRYPIQLNVEGMFIKHLVSPTLCFWDADPRAWKKSIRKSYIDQARVIMQSYAEVARGNGVEI